MPTIETDNTLQTYLLVRALVEKREEERRRNQDTAVESIDELLAQCEGTVAHSLFVEE